MPDIKTVWQESFDDLFRDALLKAAAIPCPLAFYITALDGWRRELDVALALAKDSAAREVQAAQDDGT